MTSSSSTIKTFGIGAIIEFGRRSTGLHAVNAW
jgi:hypothetical protein